MSRRLRAQSVLCSPLRPAVPRTRKTPPAVSALVPTHHRATKALASVASVKELSASLSRRSRRPRSKRTIARTAYQPARPLWQRRLTPRFVHGIG
jgi:hypothetical protein